MSRYKDILFANVEYLQQLLVHTACIYGCLEIVVDNRIN